MKSARGQVNVPDHVNENIESIAQLQRTSGARVSRHQRAIEAATQWLGRPRTLYVLIPTVGTWIAYNVAAPSQGWPVLDRPPFYWLQGGLALYAALVTTTVLTVQNRQNRESESRAHLELQVSLLAEQKATKIIALLEELRRDLPNVKNRPDPEAEAMQVRADPRSVLSALESTMEVPAGSEVSGNASGSPESGAPSPGPSNYEEGSGHEQGSGPSRAHR